MMAVENFFQRVQGTGPDIAEYNADRANRQCWQCFAFVHVFSGLTNYNE